MKSDKDASVRSRKKLAETTKQFRRLASDADKAAGAGPLLKAYQEEIDHLTRRAKFSENAFFQLYKGLYAAPDPAPALALVASSSATDDLTEENKKLKRELKEYEAEFASLKNQDITIRKLEEQVAAAARKQEDEVHQQVEKRTRELEGQLENARLEWAQQRRDYERQLEASRVELREAFARLDSMQLCNWRMLNSRIDAEMEAISQESLLTQTLQLENAQLKKQLEELLSSSTSSEIVDTRSSALPTVDADTSATQQSVREVQAEHDAVVAALRQEVFRLKEAHVTASAAAMEESKRLNIAAENAQQAQKDLEAQLAARPTMEKFHEVTRKLRILQQLEYNIVDDDDERSKTSSVDAAEDIEAVDGLEAATVEVEKILVSRVRRLEHSLQECERTLQARTTQLQSVQGELHDRDAKIREQATLIRNLEENVAALERARQNRTAGVIGGDIGSEILMDAIEDQFTGTSNSSRGSGVEAVTADAASSSSTTSSDSKMLEIVRGQRDRFRERMKELQSEKNRVEELAQSYKSTVARLETDNMQLYHKIRYLQSYGGDNSKGAGSRVKPNFSALEDGSGGASDVEARYRNMYEEKMNPFVQFNKMENQQRFTNLNPVDKILLTSAKLLLGHRITRNMAFGYILLLHFLVTAAKVALWLPVGVTVNALGVSLASVKGRSMQPTLNNGLMQDAVRDRVLLDKFSVQMRHRYERGDVVVLESPEAAGQYLIKRLVALEGDLVTDRRGGHRMIPVGKCWVEGDNPTFSDDSDSFGAVPLALIDARVVAVVWPPSEMKIVRSKLPDRVNV
ncbi:CASP-like protein [Phytophthora palmivora]|uniref:Mitochondrial inner membrane protease subunit n=1 Tax=Phytophthora palmivora TaxID=4796 RepID=A0A2P4XK67_9STRA|nr:CASP-like protein [Phytophthora palmivora]